MFEHEAARLLRANVTELSEAKIAELLEVPPDSKLGDLAFPCFPLAKSRKQAPPQIAQGLAAAIGCGGIIARAEAVGPYVNLFFDRAAIIKRAIEQARNDSFGKGEKKKDKVMIEYSQPNTHKAFHVGHIRGTSLGEALARILKYAGYDVVQANYSGDTGMHVAKWLWCYMNYHPGEAPPTGDEGSWLAEIYVEAVKRLAENPDADEEVRALNLKLDQGDDTELMELWEQTRQWSINELNIIYDEMNANFDVWWFEREFEPRAKEVSKELLERGIAEESEDAIIVNLEKEGLGVWVLLRNDGTPLYSAKDLALAEKKFNEYNIDRSIYVVGQAQALHMRQLFKTLELMEFPQAKKCFHLGYEEVRLPEGKMSSRTGQNILYREMRETVFAHTEAEIRKRHEDWDDERVKSVVEQVGMCALKYEMILRDHNKNIIYDIEKVCDFEGDTGPLIQYTHARCNSILKKLRVEGGAEKSPEKLLGALDTSAYSACTSDQEYTLAKKLLTFPNAIDAVAQHWSPGAVARYALELAQVFNSFYHKCKVVGESAGVEATRALLVDATRTLLAKSLGLLGIAAPEEM